MTNKLACLGTVLGLLFFSVVGTAMACGCNKDAESKKSTHTSHASTKETNTKKTTE